MKVRPGVGTLVAAVFSMILAALTALAGPPLICHPIAIGDAKSLPWPGNSWNLTGREAYEITHLADDTLALLAPSTPVIVRMETLRRATLYAQQNPAVAKELLVKLRSRALDAGAKGQPDALALFDLGYFVECTKQAKMTFRKTSSGSYEPEYHSTVVSGMDGLAWVERAIEMRGTDPEMEFAAALITAFPRPSVSRASLQRLNDEHLRRAAEGAREGTLLARNLVEHFENRGKTIAELRSNLAAGQ